MEDLIHVYLSTGWLSKCNHKWNVDYSRQHGRGQKLQKKILSTVKKKKLIHLGNKSFSRVSHKAFYNYNKDADSQERERK